MADKQELEISISNTGEVTVNVIGAKGRACMDMTKELEESLGIVTSLEKKSEFYQQNQKEDSAVHEGRQQS